MNANQKLQQEIETVTNSFVYRNDMSDAYHLSSEVANWLGTLISLTKANLHRPETAKTLLDIAEYIADDRHYYFEGEALKYDELVQKHITK